MNERSRWILHIKELRVAHDVSIFEAEKIALADPAWQRQIATDERCRRMALRHIRDHGDAALIGHDGTRPFVR